MVNTKPTSIAGQLKPTTQRCAANKTSTVTKIFTNSQTKKLSTAEPAFADANCPVTPLANSAAGIITAIAPQAADKPTTCLPVTPHATRATTKPASTCPATTHQGESEGFFSRSSFACSAVSGVKSETSSAPLSGGIVTMSDYAEVTDRSFVHSLRLYVETRPTCQTGETN